MGLTFVMPGQTSNHPKIPALGILEAQRVEMQGRILLYQCRERFKQGDAVTFKHGLRSLTQPMVGARALVFWRYLRWWSPSDQWTSFREGRLDGSAWAFMNIDCLLIFADLSDGAGLNSVAVDSRCLMHIPRQDEAPRMETPQEAPAAE